MNGCRSVLLGCLCALSVVSFAGVAHAQCGGVDVATVVATDCGGFSSEGCCASPSTLRWCGDDGNLCEIECSENTTATYCGWLSDQGFYDCSEYSTPEPTGTWPWACAGSHPGCGDISYTGCCEGSTLRFCVADALREIDCTQNVDAPNCGWNPDTGYDCYIAATSGPATYPRDCAACAPACGGRECGDDGCGGSCGTCSGGGTCSNGVCGGGSCTPDCAGRECGDDGCGGSCGSCLAGEACSGGTCVPSGTCTPDAFEPDNSYGAARPLSAGVSQTRSICPAGDEDFASFTLSGTSDVTVETAGPSGDTKMWLYNASQSQIGYNDDYTGLFSRIDAYDLAAGTYYVKVTEYSTSEDLPQYTLLLTVVGICTPSCSGRECGSDGCGGSCGSCYGGETCNTGTGQCESSSSCTPDSYEPDDTDTAARPLTAGSPQQHNICPAGNADWVQFTVPGESYVTLETTGTSGDTVITLYDADGYYVAEDDDGGYPTGFSLIESEPVSAGQYYLEIVEYGENAEIAGYTLTLTLEEVVCEPDCFLSECGDDGCGGSCGTCAAEQECVYGFCMGGCTPDCTFSECGDDGCGGSCGTCAAGESCVYGYCEPGGCERDCIGRECGDDGCGGSCGSCPVGETCVSGTCQGACTPQCAGRECGSDGCGGSCGSCGLGESCSSGVCSSSCVPSCMGRQCGPDGCDGSCGTCPIGQFCQNGQCSSECVPDCGGRNCGDDGCGGICGTCPPGMTCEDGQCAGICLPNCAGRQCGDNGCGGTCGSCGFGARCVDGQCSTCTAQCDGRQCGDDGCGGICGECPEPLACVDGQCIECTPACDDRVCGDDGCGGECGACPSGQYCDDDGQCITGDKPDVVTPGPDAGGASDGSGATELPTTCPPGTRNVYGQCVPIGGEPDAGGGGQGGVDSGSGCAAHGGSAGPVGALGLLLGMMLLTLWPKRRTSRRTL